MSALPPVDPERNRRLIAERLGWPDGALEAVVQLEQAHPEWNIWWTRGGLPLGAPAGYRASLRRHGHHCEPHGATLDDLRVQLVAVEQEVGPKPTFPARFGPLV